VGGHDGFNDEALSVEAATDVEVVAGGGAVQIVGQICQRVVSLGFQLIAVRILGFAGYGLYRKVQQILAIAGQLGLAGFNYASMRFMTRARAAADPEGVRGAARVGLTGVLISSSIVLVLVIVAAGPLSELFTAPGGDAGEVARLLRFASPYVPLFALMQTLRYCTQAYKTMVPSVIVGNIIQPLVRFAVGAGVLLAGFAVVGALSSLVFSMGVGALMGAWYFRRMLTRSC
jgi:O-antigen/teichoic acid export membrane protein